MMTKTLTDLILIAIIIVSITDISGFFQHMEGWLSKKVGGDIHLKILECSYCQTWWCGLIYLIYTNSLSLATIALTLIIAIQTPVIQDAIYTARDLLSLIINLIQKIIDHVNK